MKALGKKPPERRRYSGCQGSGCLGLAVGGSGNYASKLADHYRSVILEAIEELEAFLHGRYNFHDFVPELIKKLKRSVGETDG